MKLIYFQLGILVLLTLSCHKRDGYNPIDVNAHEAQIPISENSILEIGDFYKGGVVFFIDSTEKHGMVCSIHDQEKTLWGCEDFELIGANATGIGSGLQNSLDIESQCDTTHAAASCINKTGEYNDWFLPSISALNLISNNEDIINETANAYGGEYFSYQAYWSSNQSDDENAYFKIMGTGNNTTTSNKNNPLRVRAVRLF